MVSTATSSGKVASWNLRILRRASSIASICIGESCRRAAAAAGATLTSRGSSPSIRPAMAHKPSHPPSRTSSTIARTSACSARPLRCAGRARAALRPVLVELVPDQRLHIIIFSIGTTRIADAPAPLSFCSVSQNTNSWQTACTAKCPGRPCKRYDRRGLRARQQARDPVERLFRGVQHDIFGFLGREHAPDAAQQLLGDARPARVEGSCECGSGQPGSRAPFRRA